MHQFLAFITLTSFLNVSINLTKAKQKNFWFSYVQQFNRLPHDIQKIVMQEMVAREDKQPDLPDDFRKIWLGIERQVKENRGAKKQAWQSLKKFINCWGARIGKLSRQNRIYDKALVAIGEEDEEQLALALPAIDLNQPLPGAGDAKFYLLNRALHLQSRKMAKLLLANGADPNLSDFSIGEDGWIEKSSLFYCMKDSGGGADRAEIFRQLLQKGAYPNKPSLTVNGNTCYPLEHAILYADAKLVAILLDYGADPNQKIRPSFPKTLYPLFLAINGNNEEIVELLLSFGADPYLENDDGLNALAYAHRLGNRSRIIAMLKEYDENKKRKYLQGGI